MEWLGTEVAKEDDSSQLLEVPVVSKFEHETWSI